MILSCIGAMHLVGHESIISLNTANVAHKERSRWPKCNTLSKATQRTIPHPAHGANRKEGTTIAIQLFPIMIVQRQSFVQRQSLVQLCLCPTTGHTSFCASQSCSFGGYHVRSSFFQNVEILKSIQKSASF